MAELSFGELLRSHRAAAGLTQAQLAEQAGISERAVSDIERGLRTHVYPVTARSLAEALSLADEARDGFERAGRAAPRRPTEGPPFRGGIDSEGWRAARRCAMIGRGDELSGLLEALDRDTGRPHTVTGPGGSGKSRLAAEVAARYVDAGMTWVSLAHLRNPVLVVPTIAAATGLPHDASHTALADRLEAETALLVLDTFEPVLTAAGDVAALIDLTSHVRVVVTSRAPLRLRGEREWPLRPLTTADGVRLFRERARAARPGLDLDSPEAAAAVEEVVRRLDALPLAVELAAAKVRFLPLDSIVSRLVRPLELLTDGERDLPARQQTMRATVAWSYDVLSAEERMLFRRLSVFAGSWSLGALQRLCAYDDVSTVAASLGRLCECALVQPLDGVVERWRLLDPVRDFAAEQLHAAGERESTVHRHAAVVADLAVPAAAALLGTGQRLARAQLRWDNGNVRWALGHAIEHGDTDIALRVAGAVWPFWRMEGAFEEGRRWLQLALQMPGSAGSPHRPTALWGASWLALGQGDHAAAAEHGNELLARSPAQDIDHRNALTILGHVEMAEGRYPEAATLLKQALETARAVGSRWHHATSLFNLGTALLHLGDVSQARRLLERAVAEHEAVGDLHFTARSLVELGYASLIAGDPQRARSCLIVALQSFLRLGERWGLAETVAGFAVLAAAGGQAEAAATLNGASEGTYADLSAQLIRPDAALGEPFLARARSTLGERRWQACAAHGRLLAIEEAARLALDLRMV